MSSNERQTNYDIFRERISGPIIQRLLIKATKPLKSKTAKGRKNAIQPIQESSNNDADDDANEAEDLADFIDYLATEIFTSLPPSLQTLSYSALQTDPQLATTYTDPVSPHELETIVSFFPPSIIDSLKTYSVLAPSSSLPNLFSPILSSYIATTTSPPPIYSATRASACEICERDWIPLTYHHLIPKQVHAKAVKRGWHKDWELNRVAWLCRACHSFVHRAAGNEELAREFWSVELLMEREDVTGWAGWVGKVRWRKT